MRIQVKGTFTARSPAEVGKPDGGSARTAPKRRMQRWNSPKCPESRTPAEHRTMLDRVSAQCSRGGDRRRIRFGGS
jgi:hypothetical protein